MFPSPNSNQRASNSLPLPQSSASRARQKVVLQPGHSPLDWANLKSKNLRGLPPGAPPPQFVKVTPKELKLHNKVDDCWTSINGKVYNITPYVNFHPGGVKEIMKSAGRDGTMLFNKYHSWVSVDRMLSNCLIGRYEP
ncbi:increased recombination centers protein 21 [[Candida] jaroonii]|uniref:Increased recombination centers protein 21 n=1 Tax=[Candida] jaroonii TaxID=467808 RepID=A0ACA9Y8S0_9ASCO|nr:increased recombination centers protein 21 [[Candida] jaroonii]